jgi:hypothetical protein
MGDICIKRLLYVSLSFGVGSHYDFAREDLAPFPHQNSGEDVSIFVIMRLPLAWEVSISDLSAVSCTT